MKTWGALLVALTTSLTAQAKDLTTSELIGTFYLVDQVNNKVQGMVEISSRRSATFEGVFRNDNHSCSGKVQFTSANQLMTLSLLCDGKHQVSMILNLAETDASLLNGKHLALAHLTIVDMDKYNDLTKNEKSTIFRDEINIRRMN